MVLPPPQQHLSALIWTSILNAYTSSSSSNHHHHPCLTLLIKALQGIHNSACDHHIAHPSHLAFILSSIGVLLVKCVNDGAGDQFDSSWMEVLDYCLNLSITQYAWPSENKQLPDTCAAVIDRIFSLFQDTTRLHPILQSKIDAYTNRVTTQLNTQSPCYALLSTLQVVLHHSQHHFNIPDTLFLSIIQSLPRSMHDISFHLFSYSLESTLLRKRSPTTPISDWIEIEALVALVHPHTLRIHAWALVRAHYIGLLLSVLERDTSPSNPGHGDLFSFKPLSRVLEYIITLTHTRTSISDSGMGHEVFEIVYLLISQLTQQVHGQYCSTVHSIRLLDWLDRTCCQQASTIDDVRYLVLCIAHLACLATEATESIIRNDSPLCTLIQRLAQRWSFHSRFAHIILEAIQVAPSDMFVDDDVSAISVLELVNNTRVSKIKVQFTKWLLDIAIPIHFEPTNSNTDVKLSHLFIKFIIDKYFPSVHVSDYFILYQNLSAYPNLQTALFPDPPSSSSEKNGVVGRLGLPCTVASHCSLPDPVLFPINDLQLADPIHQLKLPDSWTQMIAFNDQQGSLLQKLGLQPLCLNIPALLIEEVKVNTDPISVTELAKLAQSPTHNLMVPVQDMVQTSQSPGPTQILINSSKISTHLTHTPMSPGSPPTTVMDMTDEELFDSLPDTEQYDNELVNS